MRKLFVLTGWALLAVAVATPNAFGQRDSGAKARGDTARFWDARRNRTYSRPTTVRPSVSITQPVAESYRSFSYQPATPSWGAGDAAVVTGDSTKMMRGSEVIATVPKGTRFTVLKVTDGWLGAVIEMEGTTANGWIRNTSVARETANPAVQPIAETVQPIAETAQPSAVAVQPQAVQEYRSFSYQPESSASQTTSQGAKKAVWEYPRGDSRRYRH